jgi:hypothetical protein
MQLGVVFDSEIVVGNKVVIALTDLTSKTRGSEGRGARSRAQDQTHNCCSFFRGRADIDLSAKGFLRAWLVQKMVTLTYGAKF